MMNSNAGDSGSTQVRTNNKKSDSNGTTDRFVLAGDFNVRIAQPAVSLLKHSEAMQFLFCPGDFHAIIAQPNKVGQQQSGANCCLFSSQSAEQVSRLRCIVRKIPKAHKDQFNQFTRELSHSDLSLAQKTRSPSRKAPKQGKRAAG